ncbi:MAG: DUF1552 domain-containing protein [Bradymonadia bacterium]
MKYLGRRQFLRGCAGGLALGLALPPLEAMFNTKGAYADGHGDDPFFGIFYWANGLPWHAVHGAQQAMGNHADLWTPSETGAGFSSTPLLEPLMRHRPSVISGLEPKTIIPPTPGGQGDGHMRGFMVALTGDRPKPEGFNHSSHSLTALRPSLDQYVAAHPDFYQDGYFFRSIEAGASTARFHGYGHWNAISYNGPDSTNLPIMDPGQLYDRLFNIPQDSTDSLKRSRVLDAVLEDARRLKQRVGSRDRLRIDAHLAHIDSLKSRIERTVPSCDAPARPGNDGPLDEKARLVGELIATAINCGLTRVFSFMLTSPASTHVFSNLNVPDGMHKTCHDGHWERVRDITLYQMEAFAGFCDAFATEHPTGGTLLDRGLIYGTSEYGEGWKHSVKELPVVLVGRAHGRLSDGVHVRRPSGNLAEAQLTALRALNLNDASFGWNGAETTTVFDELVS